MLAAIQQEIDNQKYEKALEITNNALSNKPDDIEVLFLKAEIYKKLQLASKAVNTYNEILELKPNLKKAEVERDLIHIVMLQENLDKFESTNLYDDPWL